MHCDITVMSISILNIDQYLNNKAGYESLGKCFIRSFSYVFYAAVIKMSCEIAMHKTFNG